MRRRSEQYRDSTITIKKNSGKKENTKSSFRGKKILSWRTKVSDSDNPARRKKWKRVKEGLEKHQGPWESSSQGNPEGKFKWSARELGGRTPGGSARKRGGQTAPCFP